MHLTVNGYVISSHPPCLVELLLVQPKTINQRKMHETILTYNYMLSTMNTVDDAMFHYYWIIISCQNYTTMSFSWI